MTLNLRQKAKGQNENTKTFLVQLPIRKNTCAGRSLLKSGREKKKVCKEKNCISSDLGMRIRIIFIPNNFLYL